MRRKIVAATFNFCIFSNLAIAQWFQVNQDTSFYNMSLFFLNQDTGFVVGFDDITGDGVISKTLDGGLTWDTTLTLFSNLTVHFPSETIGYTGGHDGKVYKTTDMGDSWYLAGATGFLSDYSNIYFLNNDSGFVLSWQAEILKTNNGGALWTFVDTTGGWTPFPGTGSIQFLDDSVGIMAAGQFGTYSKTFDGGNTWQVGRIDSSMFIVSIFMRNQNNGYAVGYNGKYSRTFDGGQTWTSPTIISTYDLNDIAFFSDSVGYIVGGFGSLMGWGFPYKAIILKTIDGGNNWAVEDSFPDDWLTSIFIVDNCIGYATGWKGRILKITNACSTGIEENETSSNNNIVFPNPANEYAKISFQFKAGDEICLTDVSGRILFRKTITAPTTNLKLQTSSLSPGIYFVKVSAGEMRETKKIVKL